MTREVFTFRKSATQVSIKGELDRFVATCIANFIDHIHVLSKKQNYCCDEKNQDCDLKITLFNK